MSVKSITLHVDGPNVFGDLTVTGFSTERTALEIGADFADALRRRHPGAIVTAALTPTEEQ